MGAVSRFTRFTCEIGIARVFLALLILRKFGFLMKTSFNGHQPLQFVQTFALSCL